MARYCLAKDRVQRRSRSVVEGHLHLDDEQQRKSKLPFSTDGAVSRPASLLRHHTIRRNGRGRRRRALANVDGGVDLRAEPEADELQERIAIVKDEFDLIVQVALPRRLECDCALMWLLAEPHGSQPSIR